MTKPESVSLCRGTPYMASVPALGRLHFSVRQRTALASRQEPSLQILDNTVFILSVSSSPYISDRWNVPKRICRSFWAFMTTLSVCPATWVLCEMLITLETNLRSPEVLGCYLLKTQMEFPHSLQTDISKVCFIPFITPLSPLWLYVLFIIPLNYMPP